MPRYAMYNSSEMQYLCCFFLFSSRLELLQPLPVCQLFILGIKLMLSVGCNENITTTIGAIRAR